MYSRVHIGGVPGAQFVDKVSCMYIFYIGRQSRRLNANFSMYIIRQEDQKISSMKRTTGCLWRQVCSSLPLEVIHIPQCSLCGPYSFLRFGGPDGPEFS